MYLMITMLWPLAVQHWFWLCGDEEDVDSGDDDDDDEAGSFFLGLTCQLLTTQPPPTSKTHSNLISHTIEMKVKGNTIVNHDDLPQFPQVCCAFGNIQHNNRDQSDDDVGCDDHNDDEHWRCFPLL